jgi:hypothetical protein
MLPTPQATPGRSSRLPRLHGGSWLVWLLLAVAAVFFALHFVHLTADFPNNSPWSDWSKYTDEGWYSDAAVRQLLFGHWFFQGDFNPAAALPVWPAIEFVVFKFTGVSLAAARSLTLAVFAVTLVAFYRLIARHARPRTLDASGTHAGTPLAAALCVLFLCASPFLFVFERMAILEPLLICITALALLAASHLHPFHLRGSLFPLPSSLFPSIALAILLPAAVLTKTTAIFLLPSVFYIVWARAGYRLRPALRLALPPAIAGAIVWCAYYFLLVRPHFLADYQYLFSANAYTGIELAPLASVVLNTLTDGLWMGHVLYPCFFAALILTLFWRPRLLTNPLVPALWLWIGGYFFFLAYHNNLQPRYYLVVAVPITAFVAIAIDNFRTPAPTPALEPATLPGAPSMPGAPFMRGASSRMSGIASACIATFITLAIVLPDASRQIAFLRNPTFDFITAAQSIKQIVLADKTHSHLVLSISGSDITLMTGLPSIDDDFGTDELGVRAAAYRPGWYIAWNDVEDDKADALNPIDTLVRVAAFPVMDDPDRNLLILYRLDPREEQQKAAPHTQHPRAQTPKPLVTKLGQQPSIDQLQH